MKPLEKEQLTREKERQHLQRPPTAGSTAEEDLAVASAGVQMPSACFPGSGFGFFAC
jgi:hypothetical protein